MPMHLDKRPSLFSDEEEDAKVIRKQEESHEKDGGGISLRPTCLNFICNGLRQRDHDLSTS